MNIGLIINIISLLIVILMAGIYFRKKRVDVYENKIYGWILISTLIGFSIDILSFISDIYFPDILILRKTLIRFYYAYILIFMYLMTLYLCSFSKKNKYGRFITFMMAIAVLLNFILPIHFNDGDNQIYISGGNIIFVYVVVIILVFFWIIYIAFNFKEGNRKKYFPVMLYSVCSILMLLVQYFYPNLMLETFWIAYVLILMYHSIENPDAKLLEELHKSKEISDNANEEKTLFLYNMTQEIRGITNNINGDANLILDSKDYEEIYDSARDIIATTSKFTNVTNEILDVSQIDSASIKTYSNKYDIKNILKQLVNTYGDICKNKELKFITNIDHDIPDTLYGDSIGLKEVITIILNNSVKYTNKGYVELSVNTIVKNDICRLMIAIEDSGTGIKSEDINKLKVENKSLSKANRLLTLMNGTMLISSDYGIGTKVKIILDQKIENTENADVSKYDKVFDNVSILTVDDSESGLKIIDKLLKGTNVKLDIASTGKECLDKLKVNKYDLVFLDEELSQISGIELMKKINDIRNFKTPVLLLTKDNSYEYNEDYLKSGFSDYILKPLKKEILINKIHNYTNKIT